jgi:hypothetical protein
VKETANIHGTDEGNLTRVLPSESRRLKREANAAEIIKSIKGDRWRRKVAVPKPIQIEFSNLEPGELVYFLYSAGLIKIGYTRDIYKRFADLKNMGGAPAQLIAVVPGNKNCEKSLHHIFKADRKHGEWFQISADIRRYLGCLDEAVSALMTPDAAKSAGSCLARLEIAEAAQ